MSTDEHYPTFSSSVTKFNLDAREISRLRSFQSAVAQFISTYIPRETYTPPVSLKEMYRKRTDTPKPWSRRTKSTTKKVYKYDKKKYPMHSVRRAVIYSHLASMFSGNNEERKMTLTRKDVEPKKGGDCYVTVFTYFMRHCFYAYYLYGGLKDVQKLLAQACLSNWLNSTKILRGLRSCCQSRFKYKKIRLVE